MKNTRKLLVALLAVFTLLMSFTAITASAAAGQIWTVAGESGLCGSNWSPSDTNNDMTYDSATDSYVKVYQNVKAGSYQFKCAKNHGWSTAYPSSNKTVKVDKDGSTVTITLKGTTVTATVEAPSCNHNYEVLEDTSSCLEAGKKTVKCTVCGDQYTENLAALGHYYTNGKCIRCDATTEYVTVYVDNAAKWTKVYCYTWDTNPYISWPGEAMNYDDSLGLWYYQIPKNFVNVIFSNGDGTQSADLKTPTGNAVVYNNSTKAWGELPHVHSYFYPCDKVCMECFEESNPDASHTIVHVEAKAPTCTEFGNAEYWYCSDCGYAWLDAECTVQANQMSVRLGATCATNAIHSEGVEPGCHYTGWTENWYCANCDVYYLDAACTIITNYRSLTISALQSTAEYVPAKAATCYEDGNVEYWVCYECEQVWANEALTQLTNIKNVQIAMAHAEATHVEAKAPTTTANGNLEYWYCAECGQAWLDEACTRNTNLLAVILPMLEEDAHVHTYFYPCDKVCMECFEESNPDATHTIVHVDAKAPTCTENGNTEYWYCSDCGYAWLDAECTVQANQMSVRLGATCATNAIHNEGVEAGCHYTGWTENWYCANCDVFYLDAACTIITNYRSLTIPALKDSAEYVPAKASTCTENGNVEYWVCYDCEQVWANAALTQLTNIKNVQVAPTCATNAIHSEAIEPGCHYTGRLENWYCANCDVFYLDAACTIITNYKNLTVAALKDSAEYVPAKAPTCTENGNVEYWVCYDCEQVWANEALTQLTNIKNVQVAPTCATGVIHTEGIAPGCHYTGWTENWYCPTCDVYYLDAACTMVTNYKNLTIPALQDTAEHIEAKEATCYENGNVEYWVCYECEQVWADEALTQLTNIKNVQKGMTHLEATHVEAKAPTCYENGNIEYWYCEACGQAWLDVECTRNTNLLAVVLPMAHAEATHVEAKAPACYENGNLEHWYCAECGQAWLDEACTLNTNLLAVVLPMAHAEATHVEAKAPTTTENGNLEYWYCEECGQAWLDEACTLNTNLKAVILPMIEEEAPVETPDETPDETPGEPVVELNFFQKIWLAILNFFKKLFGLI